MMNVQEPNIKLAEPAAKEHRLLSYLHNNEITTQRKISSGTGLSLATVNILLKRMIKRGLVKIERLNRRNLRYILTPNGMAFMSRQAYHYVTYSYRLINRLISVVQEIIAAEMSESGTCEIILVGEKDYLYELLGQALEREGIRHRFFTDTAAVPPGCEQVLFFVWDYRVELELKQELPKVINVLLFL